MTTEETIKIIENILKSKLINRTETNRYYIKMTKNQLISHISDLLSINLTNPKIINVIVGTVTEYYFKLSGPCKLRIYDESPMRVCMTVSKNDADFTFEKLIKSDKLLIIDELSCRIDVVDITSLKNINI